MPPVAVAIVNNVRVPVHRNSSGRYAVAWYEYKGAKRQRRTFKRKKAAETFAHQKATAIANGQADAMTLHAADRDSYRLALRHAAAAGIPLHCLAEEAATARALLPPGGTLVHAARYYAESQQTAPILPPTAELVADLLHHLRTHPAHRRSDAYLRALKPRLTAFATAFPDFTTATPAAVRRWMSALEWKQRPIAPKTFNHYRATISTLHRWAVAEHATTLPNPIAAIPAVHAPGKREVFTPAELRTILAATPPEWIPYIALGAFAGLRACEIHRLEWSAFEWSSGELRIDEHVAGKRGSPRNVPILPALAAWLAPWKRHAGRIYPDPEPIVENRAGFFRDHLARTIENFRWKANGLRHSFGSYHVAENQNLELTRLIMGTGAAMLRHHYNNPRFRRDAAAWFAIMPDAGKAIIPLHA